MDNKINSSIQNTQYTSQLRKAIAEQDAYRAFLLNANSIAPQPNRAYLLKSRNPISSVIIGAYDMGKDVIELGKALVTGKSNDNQLGRFNDLGMKLGSLGIASYLFTKRGTGTKGLMEFIGAGSFFAAMAAWPRLLISEPLKLLYGFDIRQQYVDAQGRKKRLYLDNQFVPDLYSQEEIDRVADKLGIDKTTHDYRELTKEKMRTIALQGNTLWMLTAGFSPLLTSMICNLAERGVTKYIVNHNCNEAIKNLDNIEQIAKNKLKDPAFNSVDAKDLKALTDPVLANPDGKYFRHAATILNPFHVIMNARDIDDTNLISDLRNYSQEITKALEESFENQRASSVTESIVNYDGLMEILNKRLGTGIADIQGNVAEPEFISQIKKAYKRVGFEHDGVSYLPSKQIEEVYNAVVQGVTNPEDIERLSAAYKECLGLQPNSKEAIEDVCKNIRNIYNTQTRPISARIVTLSEFLNAVGGQKYESFQTSVHLASLNEFMDSLHLSYSELKEARLDPERAKTVLSAKLGKIVSSDESYSSFISDITSKQAKFENSVVSRFFDSFAQKANRILSDVFELIPDDSPLAIFKGEIQYDIDELKKFVSKELGVSYEELVKRNGGEEISLEKLVEFCKQNSKNPPYQRTSPIMQRVIQFFVEEKSAGVKATGQRYILAADFERRLKTGELETYWKYLTGGQELSDSIIKACREIIYDGTMNDSASKFFVTGNGELGPKILELLFKRSDFIPEGAKVPYGSLSELTYDSCNNSLLDALNKTRNNLYNIYATQKDLARAGHIDPSAYIDANPKVQYSMFGKAASELFMETASKRFNDTHWMRIFLPLTIGVMALTIFSQLFFGKVKNEHLYGKKENGGVDANK